MCLLVSFLPQRAFKLDMCCVFTLWECVSLRRVSTLSFGGHVSITERNKIVEYGKQGESVLIKWIYLVGFVPSHHDYVWRNLFLCLHKHNIPVFALFSKKTIVLVNNLYGNENIYHMNVPIYTHLWQLQLKCTSFCTDGFTSGVKNELHLITRKFKKKATIHCTLKTAQVSRCFLT